MSCELQRLVRICKFKKWDLNFHYEEERRQSQTKKILSGDLVITELSTGTVVAIAHDLNEGRKQVVRTCCQTLLGRNEVRRAERELKEHQKGKRKKLKAQRYLDAALDPSTRGVTEERLSLAQDRAGVEETKDSEVWLCEKEVVSDSTSIRSVTSTSSTTSLDEGLSSNTIASVYDNFTPAMKSQLAKLLINEDNP